MLVSVGAPSGRRIGRSGLLSLRGYPGAVSLRSQHIARVPTALRAEPLSHNKTSWSADAFFDEMELKAAAFQLSRRLLEGELSTSSLQASAEAALRAKPASLARLAQRILHAFRPGSRPPGHRLARFLAEDRWFTALIRARGSSAIHSGARVGGERRMHPAAGAPQEWTVRSIRTAGELAAMLNLTVGELEWFADRRGLERRVGAEPLRHYRYRWSPKRSGGARLLEAPKPRLKRIQRFILDEILAKIPPDEAAHGFRSGRSIRTFAEPHAGKAIVMRFDLKEFFGSVRRARVLPIFLTAGYPEEVARYLAGLCTNSVPSEILAAAPGGSSLSGLRKRYGSPHLPQGAPTSPALANLCAFRLDCRLAGLARSLGAEYTRYADDLLFSGGAALGRGAQRLHVTVARIALEEGFEIATRKTRVMRQGVAQRACGLVLNANVNVPRRDFDRLKATLTNCVRHGPESQRNGIPEFRAHLLGRVAHVRSVNAARGAKLQAILDRIEWNGPAAGATSPAGT